MSYSKDIAIDKSQLDYEWLRQSLLYFKYSELYANAIFERDKAKERLEVVKAKIDLDIRKSPEEYGISRITEGAIASAITLDEEYVEAKNDYLNAVKEVNILAGVKGALEHKKSALETLAKLYLSGYWGEAKIPAEARTKYSKDDERQTEALKRNNRLKTRTRSK